MKQSKNKTQKKQTHGRPQVAWRDALSVASKEARSGVLMGALLGFLVLALAYAWPSVSVEARRGRAAGRRFAPPPPPPLSSAALGRCSPPPLSLSAPLRRSSSPPPRRPRGCPPLADPDPSPSEPLNPLLKTS